MNRLKQFTEIIKNWKVPVTVVAAIVVLITMYALILPAATLDEDTAKAQGGITMSDDKDAAASSDAAEPADAESGDADAADADVSVVKPDDADVDAAEPEDVQQSGEAVQEGGGKAAATKGELTATDEEKTYNIGISFGKQAGIPADAELITSEITEETEGYDEYLERAQEAIGKDKTVAFARFFDISIMSGGEEIQPADNVEVMIEVPDDLKKEDVSAIHFGEPENEKDEAEDVILETEVGKSDTKKMESAVTFETDGFSVYAVVTTTVSDLDGATYGILNNNNSVAGYALTDSANGATKLKGKSMVVKVDPVSRTDNVFVAENSNITMWFFEKTENEKFYISTGTGSDKKYLRIFDDAVSLVDRESVDEYCLITIEKAESGTYKGKFRFRHGDKTLYWDGSNFFVKTVSNNNFREWMNLAEESNLTDDSFVTYTAQKVSVSDRTNVHNGQQVILYTRVWNDNTGRYDYYIVDYDGMLVKAYASGDEITWVGSNTNTMLWDFTEYYYEGTNTPNNYYELQNNYSGKYIAPQITGGSFLSDNKIGINLNGRRNNQYYSTVIAWDDPYYDYAALKVKNWKLISAPIAKADSFYFAIMSDPTTTDELTRAETIDSKEYGITLKIQDYPYQEYDENGKEINGAYVGGKYRSKTQADILGINAESTNTPVSGLLSKNLDENGYPNTTTVAADKGGQQDVSLYELYNEAHEVNQQFLLNTQKETGYFEYDSTQNFAHLITSKDDKWYHAEKPGGGLYELYDFVIYNQLGTSEYGNKDTLKHGQFLPFNDLTEGVYSRNNPTNQTDLHGNPLSSLDPRKGEKLYGISARVPSNPGNNTGDCDYFFGMEMSASFMQSESGEDDWGHDLIFEFSGDDDFWFYVDGMLVLDLGGVHSALDGSINFKTGKVVVNGRNTDLRTLYTEAYQEKYPDATEAEIKEFLDGDEGYFVDGGTVFRDYSGHTMKMFYMERGASASNLHMRFNLAPYNDGEVLLEKELDGIDNPDPNLTFPYQIWYKDKSRPNEPYVLFTDKHKVTDTKTGDEIPYEASYEAAEGLTYEHVFFVKPGQIASIMFGEELGGENTEYYITECGVDTTIYDKVKINKADATGVVTDPPVQNLKDFNAPTKRVSDRKKIIFNNHVSETAQHTLRITKRLYQDFDKQTKIRDDNTPFRFRLYIGKDSENNYVVYNTGKYRVIGPDGCYCFNENEQFVSSGKSNFNELSDEVPEGEWKSEKEKATFYASQGGGADKIPPWYTVEVPELLAGTEYKVVERADEIPVGYNLIDYEDDNGHATDTGTIGVGAEGNRQAYANNQHGYGLTAQKIWSDADFMKNHDYIYFAIYVKDGNNHLKLKRDSVRRLGKTATTIKWFLPELEDGKTLNDYLAYEIVLEEGHFSVDEATGVVTLDDDYTPTRIDEGETITVHGEGNEHGYSADYVYTASYDRQVLTTQQINNRVNSRKDKITNARPGIKLVKSDLDGEPLEGGVFELKKADESSDDNMVRTFTSDENGLIAVAYLPAGEEYLLTETSAPYKFKKLIDPLTIKVVGDDLYVNGSKTPPSGAYYTIDQVDHPTYKNMPTLTVKNKPVTLNAFKYDVVTKRPIEGIKFRLYREVKDNNNLDAPDNRPMEGFENLVTDADGLIPLIDLDHLEAGVYYLHEEGKPAQYEAIDYYVRLIIDQSGAISIQKTTYDTRNHKYVSKPFADDEAKLEIKDTDTAENYTVKIYNNPEKSVRILKKDYDDTTVLSGAAFSLFGENQINPDDGKPLPGEYPIVSGTTNQDGLLDLGTLAAGKVFYLFEDTAPDGYTSLSDPIIITVSKSGLVTARLGGDIENPLKKDILIINGVEVTQLTVYNSAGVELPSTGGPGTTIIYILGAILVMLSAAGLVAVRRRRIRL